MIYIHIMNEFDDLPETHLLATFLAVAREGTLTEAAQVLHRSQPAVSHRLKQLEEWAGVELFEKVGRTLELTEFGRRMQSEAIDALARLNSVRQALHEQTEEPRGIVRIGTFPTIARHGIIDAIEEIISNYPELKLVFRFGLAPDMIEQLRVGALDALVLIGEVRAPGLAIEEIGEIRVVAVTSTEVEPSSLEDLKKMRYLAWSGPTDPTFTNVRRFVQANGLETPTTPEIPHIETLRALAASGHGYTILPDYTTRIDRSNGLINTTAIPGLDESFAIHLIGRSRQVHGPALARVKDIIRGCWN